MNLAGIQSLFTHDGPFPNLHLDVSRDTHAFGQGVESLKEESGQDREIARGLRDVLQALVRGQVERVVVDLAAAHEHTISIDDYAGLKLRAAAAEGRLPADQALVAAGALTDADLTVLPASAIGGDGVAALLRWDDAA